MIVSENNGDRNIPAEYKDFALREGCNPPFLYPKLSILMSDKFK